MNIQAEIKRLNEERGAKIAALEAIQKKAETETRIFTQAENEEFDKIKGDIKTLDEQIARLVEMEKLSAERAQSVTPQKVEVKDQFKDLDKGILFTRLAVAKAAAKDTGIDPITFARHKYGQAFGTLMEAEMVRSASKFQEKAAVPLGETGTPGWASELVDTATRDFIELLRPMSIVSRVPAQRISFGVEGQIDVPRQTSNAVAGYVGEGGSIKAGKLSFDSISLSPKQLAVIVPISNKLMRHSNPSVEGLIRDDLVRSTAEAMDLQFLNGTAVPGVAPGGVTNGLPAGNTQAATGAAAPTLDQVTAGIRFLSQSLRTANVRMIRPVCIISPRTLEFLKFMRDGNGNYVWKDEITQGRLNGAVIVDSTTVPIDMGAGTDESFITMADADQILIAEDLAPVIDTSTEATIQADDDPASPPDLSSNQISAFQQDSVLFRVRMAHDWQRRQDAGVSTLTAVQWGA